MLRDAPEQTVAVRQCRSLRQVPDHAREHERQEAQTTAITTEPFGTRATQMTVEEPQRDQRMTVDERETKEVRSEPVQRGDREPDWNGPRPIRARLLLVAQPNQQAEPEQQCRVPAGG